MTRVRTVALGTLAILGAACKRDKPHVPYTIDSTATPTATIAHVLGTSTVAPLPKLPPSNKEGPRLLLGAYESGDVLSIVPGGSAGERTLMVARPSRPEEKLLSVDIPIDASCTLHDELGESGSRSVLMRVSPECKNQDAFSAPTRISETVLISFARGTPRPTRMRIERPPGYPDLRVKVEATDLDGDGFDDATWTFEVGTAQLAIRELDRGSGMSRDVDEPEGSLRKLVTSARARLGKPKEAAKAAEELADMSLVFAEACGGRPRAQHDGKPGLACGASSVIEEARALEVSALVSAGNIGRALNAYERGFAARTLGLEAKWKDARQSIERAVSSRDATGSTFVVEGNPPAYRPAWRLAFDGDDILVRTEAGAKRIFTKGGESKDEPAAPDTQAPVRAGSSGFTLKSWTYNETFDPGDGVAMHATFMGSSGDRVADVALPVPGAWKPLGNATAVAVTPFAATDDALYLLVGTESVRIDASGAALAWPKDSARAPGSPGSSAGKRWVMPTSLGLFVGGEGKPLLVRGGKDLEGAYRQLAGCTVDDAGARIACLRGQQVRLLKF